MYSELIYNFEIIETFEGKHFFIFVFTLKSILVCGYIKFLIYKIQPLK